jgi:hypothetical protein
MHPEQARVFRSMTAEDKLRLSVSLYDSARKLKAAGLRQQHPDWPEEKVAEKVREMFLTIST